jgi:pyruvate formate lyase activating enzyme
MVATELTVGQAVEEIEKDAVFYNQSGGGVTFSGGEPLMQPESLRDILRACREREIHTAVDTNGYADSETLLRISDDVDLFLYDLKIMDSEKHERYTGVSNSMILENLRMLSERGRRAVVRFSLIPGINDDAGNIRDLGSFTSSLGTVESLHILPYHRAGVEKARRLATQGKPFVSEPPSLESLRSVEDQLRGFGLEVTIGG